MRHPRHRRFHRRLLRTGEVAQLLAHGPEALLVLAVPVEDLDPEVASIHDVEAPFLANGNFPGKIELAGAGTPLADVEQVLAVLRVEHPHAVLFGSDAPNVDDVQARAIAFHRHAGEPVEELGAAYPALELACRIEDDNGLRPRVRDVKSAVGVHIDPKRTQQLPRAVLFADLRILALRNVEDLDEGVG
jgi:hypothetical protein